LGCRARARRRTGTITGRLERPSWPPLENRKAGSRPSCGGERAQLHQLYAAKIAAARLYARPDELAVIIAALRDEEQAALDALKVQFSAQQKPLFAARPHRGHHLRKRPQFGENRYITGS
jgi:hypothetical protein